MERKDVTRQDCSTIPPLHHHIIATISLSFSLDMKKFSSTTIRILQNLDQTFASLQTCPVAAKDALQSQRFKTRVIKSYITSTLALPKMKHPKLAALDCTWQSIRFPEDGHFPGVFAMRCLVPLEQCIRKLSSRDFLLHPLSLGLLRLDHFLGSS